MSDRFIGKVTRLSTHSTFTLIRLDSSSGVDCELQKSPGFSNYDALYSLALEAAIRRLPLTVRFQTIGDPAGPPVISALGYRVVQYAEIDWQN